MPKVEQEKVEVPLRRIIVVIAVLLLVGGFASFGLTFLDGPSEDERAQAFTQAIVSIPGVEVLAGRPEGVPEELVFEVRAAARAWAEANSGCHVTHADLQVRESRAEVSEALASSVPKVDGQGRGVSIRGLDVGYVGLAATIDCPQAPPSGGFGLPGGSTS